MNRAALLSTIRTATLGSLLLLPGHAIGQSAPVEPKAPAEEWAELGWMEAPWPTAPASELDVPRFPAGEAIRTLQKLPSLLPRPVVRLGDRRLTLPLAARAELLERIDDAPVRLLTWSVRARAADLGAGFAWVDVDLAPLRSDAAESDERFRRDPETEASMRALTAGRRPLPGWRMDRGPHSTGKMRVVEEELVAPTLEVRPVAELDVDAKLVASESGAWMAVELEGASRRTHELGPGDMHGSALGERRVLFAAPRPMGPGTALHLFAVEDGQARDLGSVALPSSSWSQEVQDARLVEGATIEAIVVVTDPSPRSKEPDPPWGAIVRQARSGAWTEVRRFALPATAEVPRVRFAPGGLTMAAGQRHARLSFESTPGGATQPEQRAPKAP